MDIAAPREAVSAVDGVRIFFQESGAGPTIVLVHGSGLSRAIWRGLGFTKALQGQFHVVALDLRGHGRSDKPQHEDAYGMDLLVRDILAVLDAAGVQAAHYLGIPPARESGSRCWPAVPGVCGRTRPPAAPAARWPDESDRSSSLDTTRRWPGVECPNSFADGVTRQAVKSIRRPPQRSWPTTPLPYAPNSGGVRTNRESRRRT